MIGILCSNRMEKGHAKILHSLSRKLNNENNDQIVVFTISNIDFANKTITGSLITEPEIRHVKVPIPEVILNLAVQREKDGIKRQRALAGMESIRLINDLNRFDQQMIMEILAGSRATVKYLLPFYIYNKEARNFKPDENKSYIAMPARGSSLSRIIFTIPDIETDKVFGTQYFKKGHIRDYIDASLCQKYWIFIELPRILTNNNHPVVIRNYLQKGSGGDWSVLGKEIHPRIKFEENKIFEKINEASLTAVNHLNKFLPSIGHCFIDFILSSDGDPFFLHLGGFTHSFLNKKHSEDFYKNFYENMIGLYSYYNQTKKEG